MPSRPRRAEPSRGGDRRGCSAAGGLVRRALVLGEGVHVTGAEDDAVDGCSWEAVPQAGWSTGSRRDMAGPPMG